MQCQMETSYSYWHCREGDVWAVFGVHYFGCVPRTNREDRERTRAQLSTVTGCSNSSNTVTVACKKRVDPQADLTSRLISISLSAGRDFCLSAGTGFCYYSATAFSPSRPFLIPCSPSLAAITRADLCGVVSLLTASTRRSTP